MNGQHFKELLECVCRTLGTSKREFARNIGVSIDTFIVWQRKGVPVSVKPVIVSRLYQEVRDYVSR